MKDKAQQHTFLSLHSMISWHSFWNLQILPDWRAIFRTLKCYQRKDTIYLVQMAWQCQALEVQQWSMGTFYSAYELCHCRQAVYWKLFPFVLSCIRRMEFIKMWCLKVDCRVITTIIPAESNSLTEHGVSRRISFFP